MLRLSFADSFEEVIYTAYDLDTAGNEDIGVVNAADYHAALDELNRTGGMTLSDPGVEASITRSLASALIPEAIRESLASSSEPPLLIIRPSRSLARVPWGLLEIEPGVRLLELARVRLGYPLGLTCARQHRLVETDGGLCAVVDPHVRGPRVLDRDGRRHWASHLADLNAIGQPGEVTTRVDLHRRLTAEPQPNALLFFGHCTTADDGRLSRTGLILSDGAGTQDDPTAPRPLSARDLAVGTLERYEQGLPERRPGADVWPMPARVGIVACSSGTDATLVEQLGLAAVLHHSGAAWLAGSLWDIPTDMATGGATTDLGVAVGHALLDADPDTYLDDWTRSRLAAWRSQPSISNSPATWGALAVFSGADYVNHVE